jgi:MFS superfamily sulfate permease-like transporter
MDLGGMFDISPSAIFAAILFSAIGWWLYREGKRLERTQNKIFGGLLMFYSYFTPASKHAWIDWAVGILICAIVHHYWDRDII